MGTRIPRQDVSTNRVNPHDPGNGQSARLGVPHGVIKLAATTIYDGQGNAMGKVFPTQFGKGRSGGLNAGEITTLRVPGKNKPIECVYAWDVSTSTGPASGWVPLSAVSPKVQVQREESAIAQRIRSEQGPDGHHFTTMTIVPKTAEQAGHRDLYVFPNQNSPVANKADYFYSRGRKSGIFLNVPVKGDSGRYGIADDIVSAGTQFHVDDDVRPMKVGLYHRHQSNAVGSIRFVYGYFVNSAGNKRHGWINAGLLH
jgi:hypothetical protein